MASEFNENIYKALVKRLNMLTWNCSGCPQVPVCEEQDTGGEPRYCLPLIEAAVLEKDDWKTEHSGPTSQKNIFRHLDST